jgi:hypothetical protein
MLIKEREDEKEKQDSSSKLIFLSISIFLSIKLSAQLFLVLKTKKETTVPYYLLFELLNISSFYQSHFPPIS